MEITQENQIDTNRNIDKKTDFLFRFSAVFFILVLILTLGLYFYKSSLESSLNDTNNEISTTDKSINDLKNDKKLQVYNLYTMNKSKIDNDFKKSNINSYINHLSLTSAKYWIKFTGFAYDTKKITTTLSSTTDLNLWYLKLVKFIAEYRTQTNDLLDLWFISSIDGSDKITTNVVFDVK